MISGIITELKSNTPLPGANVYLSDSNGVKLVPVIGAASDINGFYNLDLNSNSTAEYITASYIGYKTVIKELANMPGNSNEIINFFLEESNSILPTFEVVAQKKKKIKTPLLIGASLLALILGIIIYKNVKK